MLVFPRTPQLFPSSLFFLSANWLWPGSPWVLPATASKTGVFILGLQTCGPPCSVPWISPEGSASPHIAVIGLDAYLRYRSP